MTSSKRFNGGEVRRMLKHRRKRVKWTNVEPVLMRCPPRDGRACIPLAFIAYPIARVGRSSAVRQIYVSISR